MNFSIFDFFDDNDNPDFYEVSETGYPVYISNIQESEFDRVRAFLESMGDVTNVSHAEDNHDDIRAVIPEKNLEAVKVFIQEEINKGSFLSEYVRINKVEEAASSPQDTFTQFKDDLADDITKVTQTLSKPLSYYIAAFLLIIGVFFSVKAVIRRFISL